MSDHGIVRFDTNLEISSPYYFGEGIVDRFPEYLGRHDFDRCFLITSRKLLNLFGLGDLVIMAAQKQQSSSTAPLTATDLLAEPRP